MRCSGGRVRSRWKLNRRIVRFWPVGVEWSIRRRRCMTLNTLTLAILGLLISFTALLCIHLLSRRIKQLEERVAWLEGTQPVEEGERKPEPDIPEILKVGATQPPGSA